MTTWFVSRHAGAMHWIAEQGRAVDRCVSQLDPQQIAAGDVVIGTLPVHVAAAVCARGAHYLHLHLDQEPAQRGTELSAAAMRAAGARLEEYRVERVAPSPVVSP